MAVLITRSVIRMAATPSWIGVGAAAALLSCSADARQEGVTCRVATEADLAVHCGARPIDVSAFGNVSQMIGGADATGDGLADLLVAAPTASVEGGENTGRVALLSLADGTPHWVLEGSVFGEGFGADVSLGPDADGDGLPDVAVAVAPTGRDVGLWRRVRILSGRDGSVAEEYHRPDGLNCLGFGRAVSLGPDVDGDGLGDLVVADRGSGPSDLAACTVPTVFLVSSATRAAIRTWTDPAEPFFANGSVRLGPDRDGDGSPEVMIMGVTMGDERGGWSWLRVYSTATGETIEHWDSRSTDCPFANYGGDFGADLDGDMRGDLTAVGGVWGPRPSRRPYQLMVEESIAITSTGVLRRLGTANYVAIGADGDSDGLADLAVGQIYEGTEVGEDSVERPLHLHRARVVQGRSGDPIRTVQVDDPTTLFGLAASLSPDGDGDGEADLVVLGGGRFVDGPPYAIPDTVWVFSGADAPD